MSTVDPADQGSWSGITYHMFRTLSMDHEVTWAGPVRFPKWAGYLYRYWNKLNILLNRKFTSHNYLNAFFSARVIRKKLRDKDYDCIVIGAGEPELVAFLETRIPIIYIADTSFDRMVDYYPWHTGLCQSAIKQGNRIEKKAIDKSFHIIYSSEWAAESALLKYGAGRSKISVAAFGPSLVEVPPVEEIENKSQPGKLHLLFIGSNWERKGGTIAYEAYKSLKESGLDCVFTIVGSDPGTVKDVDCTVYPYLDKNDPADMQSLYNIFLDTDILISPSRADCTPVAFSEAAAFGIPVLTTQTGGISSIVIDGKNGYCLPHNAAPEAFSESMREIWQSPEKFRSLRLSSRGEYENRLNWQKWREYFNKSACPQEGK